MTTKIRKIQKLLVSAMLAFALVICAIPASTAQAYSIDDYGRYVTGCFNGQRYGSPTYVTYSSSKTATKKIKFTTYYQNGSKSSGRIDVIVKNHDDDIIMTKTSLASGSTITLPKGYTKYKVYVRRAQASTYTKGGTSNPNYSKCWWISIDAVTNTNVYDSEPYGWKSY